MSWPTSTNPIRRQEGTAALLLALALGLIPATTTAEEAVPVPTPAPAEAEKQPAPKPPDPAALARQKAIMELNPQIGAAFAEAAKATKEGDKAKADAATARFRDLDARQNRLIYEDFKLGYVASLKSGNAPDPTTPKLTELIELEESLASLKDEQAKSATDGTPAEKKAQFAEEIADLEEERQKLEPTAIYEAVYSTTILGVTRRFPELRDPQSEFSKRMDAKLDELEGRKDPLLDNPKHPLFIADEIQQQIEKEKVKAPKP